MNKKIIISLISLLTCGIVSAFNQTNDLKSTANIESVCNLTVNNINFGLISLPLTSQIQNSEMNIKCNNITAYTVSLAYGGIYGQPSYTDYFVSLSSYSNSYNSYGVYNKSGALLGSFSCGYSGNLTGKIMFGNTTVANLYGYSTSGIQVDTKQNTCVSNNTQAGTYPVGWSGAWNKPGKYLLENGGYSYGVMNGLVKGDSLSYSVMLPGDNSKVWNSGVNTYKAVGNGSNQILPINTKIVPEKSSSKYPAPDIYLDNITVVVSY